MEYVTYLPLKLFSLSFDRRYYCSVDVLVAVACAVVVIIIIAAIIFVVLFLFIIIISRPFYFYV